MALGTVTEELNDLKAVELRIESTGKQGVSLQQKQLSMFTDFFEQMRLDALKRQEAEDEAKKKAALALKTAQKDKKDKKDKDKGGGLFGLPLLFTGFFKTIGELGSRLVKAMKNFRVNIKNLFSRKGLVKVGGRLGTLLFGKNGFKAIQIAFILMKDFFKFNVRVLKALGGTLSKLGKSLFNIAKAFDTKLAPKLPTSIAMIRRGLFDPILKASEFLKGREAMSKKYIGGVEKYFKREKIFLKAGAGQFTRTQKLLIFFSDMFKSIKKTPETISKIGTQIKGAMTSIKGMVINVQMALNNSIVKPFKSVVGYFKGIGTKVGLFANSAKGVAGTVSKSAGIFSGVIKAIAPMGKKLLSFFPPIRIALNIFETIKGALDGFKAFSGGSMFEKIIGGLTGALGGLLVGTVGILADFAKNVISWLLRKVGLGGIADMLDSFSYVHIIQDFFAGMATFVTDVFSNLFAGFEDGIGPGIMGILASMTRYVKKILMLPLALIAGGVGALANLFSQKGPKQGFMEAFGKVFNFGDDAMMTKAQKDNMYGPGGTRENPAEGSRKARANARRQATEDRRAEKEAKKTRNKNIDKSTEIGSDDKQKGPVTVINDFSKNDNSQNFEDNSSNRHSISGGGGPAAGAGRSIDIAFQMGLGFAISAGFNSLAFG